MSGFSGSHCNSKGESGWTTYFEDSLETDGRFWPSAEEHGGRREMEKEEGDLSMISDASSGPRNLYYEENHYQSVARSTERSPAAKSKRKEEMGQRNKQSCLDDTATSHVFGLSKRETKPYTKEAFLKQASQSHSRKQHGKKQASLYRSSSSTKLAKDVTGDLQEAKWEQ